MTLCRGQRGARELLIGQVFLKGMSSTSYYEYIERLLCNGFVGTPNFKFSLHLFGVALRLQCGNRDEGAVAT